MTDLGFQIWGFEMINGQRFHTRRIVVANNKGHYVLGRLVYYRINQSPDPAQ
jgi:hypothetical protein